MYNKNPIEKAYTVGEYVTDEPQTVTIRYEDNLRDELWCAIPSCQHELQAQLSGGVKCIKCGGWYAF